MDRGNWTFKKIVGLSFLGLAAAAALAGGVYYAWLITPPGPPRTAAEAIKTIASARYQRLPEYRKNEYLEQAQNLIDDLPQDQRRELFQSMRGNEAAGKAMMEVREQSMMKQAVAYAQASPDDKVKLLDAAIDKMGDRMRGMGMGGPPPGGGGGGGGGQRDGNQAPQDRKARMKDRMEDRIQTGNPQANALIGEYFRALRERRQQRGGR